jgi:glycosyltransferase involved in cell wall biosynthesis
MVRWHLVVPAMTVSGGIRETLRLGEEMADQGAEVDVLSMWRSDNPMPSALRVEYLSDCKASVAHALLRLPLLAARFSRWLRVPARRGTASSERFLFTHYATLPLALFVPSERRFFFVQDLEWKFVSNPHLSGLLRRMIMYFYRRGTLVSANGYLTSSLAQLGIPAALEAPIWADKEFLAQDSGPRDIDFTMMLRKGAHKRLDYYRSFIDLARSDRNLKLAVISPEPDLIASVRGCVDVCLVRPSLEEMRALYQRSKCFVHLSEHEGFGLPPLEAMGAGCVPLCRDSGGVRAFMESDELSALLLPASASVEEIYQRGRALLADDEQLRDYGRRARDVFRRGLIAAARADGCIRRLVG